MASCSANPVPATLAGRRLPAADDNQGGGHRNRCNYEDRQERWAIGLMEGRTNHGPANMTLHNAVLGCLRGASFSMEMTVHAYSMQDAYIYGFALQEMDMSSVSAEDFAAEAQRQMHESQTWPQQIFLGTLTQAGVVIAASLISGRLYDRTGRRKNFVLTAAIVYGLALFVVAIATNFSGFLVGMAISGLGFGMYVAVDLALVADVLPDTENVAKDLGVFNIAGALPFCHRAGDRAGHPGDRQRQLRRAVHGGRVLRPHRSHRHSARERCPVRS